MSGSGEIKSVDLGNWDNMLELLALQTAAYVKEAEMVGLTDVPPLLESPESLRSSGEMVYGWYGTDLRLAGAVSLQEEPGTAELGYGNMELLRIKRLMVHPDRFRQGIASRLLEFVLYQLAAEAGASAVVVSAVSTNKPALTLYSKFCFRAISQSEAPEGLKLMELCCDQLTPPVIH